MTKHIVAQAKNYESDTIPGDFATLTAPCPEMRRRSAREVQEIPVRRCAISASGRSWAGASSSPPKPRRCCRRARSGRSTASAAGSAGRSPPSSSSPTPTKSNSTSARAPTTTTAQAPDFSGADAARPVPEVRQSRVRDAERLRLRARRRRRTHLRFPLGPHDPAAADRARADAKAARRPARPTCCSSCRRARADRSRRILVRAEGRQGRLRVRGRRIRRARVAPRRARRAAARAGRASARRQPVELHAGRYGPYVKHGDVNATLPDRDKVDSLTLDEAIALVDEKAGRSPARTPRRRNRRHARAAQGAGGRRTPRRPRRRAATRTAAGNGATAARAAAKPRGEAPSPRGTRGVARNERDEDRRRQEDARRRARPRRRRATKRRATRGASGAAAHGGEIARSAPARGRASRPIRRVRRHVEPDSLRERQVAAPVDRVRLPAHVGLPRVRARLAAAAGLLLAAERAADLGARRADVHVGDAAIAARRREKRFGGAHARREDRRRQPLRHAVVLRDRVVDRVERASRRGSARTSRAARRRACVVDAGDDRRLDEESRASSVRAAADDRAARCARLGDRAAIAGRRRAASISGPISVAGSSGSPMRTCAYAAREPRERARRLRARCTISRRVVVQRWPAVPTAPNTTAGTTRSRSASSATMIALLPRAFEQHLAEARGDRALRRRVPTARRAGERHAARRADRRRALRPSALSPIASAKTGGRPSVGNDAIARASARRARRAASSATASTRRHCRTRTRASRSTPTPRPES